MISNWAARHLRPRFPTGKRTKQVARGKPRSRSRLLLEELEARALPSVSYTFLDTTSTIVIAGTTGANNTISIANSGTNTVVINGTDTGVASASISEIDLTGDAAGPADDTFDLSGVASAAYSNLLTVNVDGATGNNALITNNANHTFSVLGNDGGSGSNVTSDTDFFFIFFTSVGNLTGGSGSDSFVLADGVGVSGVLTGGAGLNTLDYSNYSTAVQVNLQGTTVMGVNALSATNVDGGAAGGISGIQNVTGGSGSDVLIADGNNNLLTGGLGDDTLVATTGTATLDGGPGNNDYVLSPDGLTATSYTVTDDGTGSSTVDFSGSGVPVTVDMDSAAGQAIAPNTSLTFTNASSVANFVGSSFDDTVFVDLLQVPRSIDGGPNATTSPGDTMFFNAEGQSIVVTPTGVTSGTISAVGFGTVSYTSIESLNLSNINQLTVSGTSGDDTLVLTPTGGGNFQYQLNGNPLVTVTSVNSFEFDGLAGNDRMQVNVTSGNPLPSGGVLFNGGTNNGPPADRLQVVGINAQSATDLPDGTTSDKGAVNLPGIGTASYVNSEGLDLTGFGTVTLTTPNGGNTIGVQNGTDFYSGTTNTVDFSGTSNGVTLTSLAVWADSSVVLDTATNTAGPGGPGLDTVNITSASATNGGTPALGNFAINTGVTGSDHVNVNGAVTTSGNLSVQTAAITQTAGTVTVNGGSGTTTLNAALNGVNQTGGHLLSGQLLLLGAGTFSLGAATNNVNTLAANIAGNLSYTDADGFTIDTVGLTNGVSTGAGHTLSLNIGSGAITQNQAVSTANLELLGTGTYTLTNGSNSVGTVAANITGTLSLTDAGALIVGTAGSTSGITTHGGTVTLTTTGPSGTLAVNQAVSTAGGDANFHTSQGQTLAATVNAGAGTIWLDPAAGSVTQSAPLIGNNLRVTPGDGSSVSLSNAGNAIANVAAATHGGDFTFFTTGTLNVSTIGTTVGVQSGVAVGAGVPGGNISLTSTNNLNVNQVVDSNPVVSSFGTLTIGGGVFLNAAVNVGQGNVTLNGGGLDIVITSNQSFPVNVSLVAPRDVIIRAVVQTTSSAHGNLTLKGGTSYVSGGFGEGGVWVDHTGANTGQLISAGFLTISGKDVFATAGTNQDAIRLEGPISTTTAANGLITLSTDTTGTAGPAGAGTFLGSNITSAVTSGAAVTINNAVTLDATSSVAATGGNISFASTINGVFGLTLDAKNGGAASGNISVTGSIGASAALASLTVSNANNATFSQSVTTTGDVVQTAGTGTTTLNAASIGGKLDLTTVNITLTSVAPQYTVGGVVNLTASGTGLINGTVAAGTSTVTLAGGGYFKLGGTNRFSSGTDPVVLAGNTTLDFQSFSQTFGSLASSVTGAPISGQLVKLGTGTLTTGNAVNTEFDGIISGTGGALVKQGSDTFTLGNANTYTGATTINAGTLMLGVNQALYTATSVTIQNGTANGSTLAMNSHTDTVAGVHLIDGSITGPGTLTDTTAFDVQKGTVSANFAGSVGLTKSTANTVTFTAASNNTYTGTTTISAGTLTLFGTLTGTGGAVNMTGANVTLNGTGTISGSGRGVVVTGAGDLIGAAGAGNGLTITNVGGTAVLVNATTATVSILGDVLQTGPGLNGTGIDVNGGKALVQDDNLQGVNATSGVSNPYYGLKARSGAVVDAGQMAGLNIVITGLGFSAGNNNFSGYQDYTAGAADPSTLTNKVSQAVLDENMNLNNASPGPQGAPWDLYAQNNDFGFGQASTSYAAIEKKVYHDNDYSKVGFVNYTSPTSTTPSLKDVRFYSVSDAEAVSQRSQIRRIRLAFDNYVVIQSGALTLTTVQGAEGQGLPTISMTVTGTSFDPVTGQFRFEFGFGAQTGVEVTSGSLMDGKYKINVNNALVRTGSTSGPALNTFNYSAAGGFSGTDGVTDANNNEIKFWRVFGDLDGLGYIDQNDINMMNAALGSLSNMANYNRDLDFNNDGSIDTTTDLPQFNARKTMFYSPATGLFW